MRSDAPPPVIRPGTPVRRLCIRTHRKPDVASRDASALIDEAIKRGIEVHISNDELERHPDWQASFGGRINIECTWQEAMQSVDAVVVLAGDGTLLETLADSRSVPVLGLSYGILGYLSGGPAGDSELIAAALENGEWYCVDMPTLGVNINGEHVVDVVNDVVATGGVSGGIIEVGWSIASDGIAGDDTRMIDEMGSVPCDGMVIATPVGSTAYNLSNGGPVVAWGTGGYVVSFIAPHTLSARPLVVARGHTVTFRHLGRGAALKLFADGRDIGVVSADNEVEVTMNQGTGPVMALVEPRSFYARYRDCFARQADSFIQGGRS